MLTLTLATCSSDIYLSPHQERNQGRVAKRDMRGNALHLCAFIYHFLHAFSIQNRLELRAKCGYEFLMKRKSLCVL